MRGLHAILFLGLWYQHQAQVMWQIKKDTVVKWYYYDGDEFNDPDIDRAKWHTAFSWSEINYDMRFRMTPERLVQEGGVCKFMCYRDTGFYKVPPWQLDSVFKAKYQNELSEGNLFKYYFTAGDVWSKGYYERGYFELRFKSTNAFGMYPGYWLYGDNGDEIDFFELKGERGKEIHIDVHCKNRCDKNYKGFGLFRRQFGDWLKLTRALDETYNVLGCEWGEGYVRWYLNGEGIACHKGNFGSKKMALILGTGPAQDGKPFDPGVNATTAFPNSFDVDYVRVWYKEQKTSNEVLGKAHKDFDFYKAEPAEPARLRKKIKYLYDAKTFEADLATLAVLPKRGKKVILNLLGNLADCQIEFKDESGKVILTERVKQGFAEFDFAAQKNLKEVYYTSLIGGKILTGQLQLLN